MEQRSGLSQEISPLAFFSESRHEVLAKGLGKFIEWGIVSVFTAGIVLDNKIAKLV